LLVIFGKSVINNGTISSNGSKTNTITIGSNSGLIRGGGSGAGSVNIFYVNNMQKGTISIAGGVGSGNGGNGSKSIGKIVDGIYVEYEAEEIESE